MIEINLIPDVKRDLLRTQRMRASVISISIITSVVSVGVVTLLLLYITGVQNVRGYFLDTSIKDGNATLQKTEDLSKILTIQSQLAALPQLNDQKAMSSRIFDTLAAVIPPKPNDVQISLVSVDTGQGTIRLEGQTRGYDSMEVFKKTLDSALVEYADPDSTDGARKSDKLASEISTGEVSYGEDTTGQRVLRFTLTFKYAPALLSSKIDSVNFKLSVSGNVTDSYLGIPKSIFTEKAKDVRP